MIVTSVKYIGDKVEVTYNKSPLRYFVIPFTMPGLNDVITLSKQQHGKYSPYNKLKQSTQVAIAAFVRRQRVQTIDASDCPLKIDFMWIDKNKRRNPDNIRSSATKMIIDSLVKQSDIIPNDGWKQVRSIADYFNVSADNPKIEVRIFSLMGD